jgi:DNA polymerase-3 subunit gamma/tau
VVGQEPVVRTLRNAVERGRVHHAYLFVGSRGTGKTSMAKILAACLNCERGPTVEPCGVCESCTSIAAATSLDVIEMDAASNNSVDDIRELRESVAYAPVSGREKVYILDEAHMLSPQAWNAFLKTLEEPPPNTIFVLATTEAQKVPATVVDRCHRFDFARPTVEQIASVVRRAAEAEGVDLPSQAVALIARSATGSFRDALGTLEQLIIFGGPSITLDDVVAVLGVADSELLFEALDAVAAHDPRRALIAVARCAEGGRDPAGFIRDLEVHARELLVVQTLGGEVPSELSLTPEADERLAAQAQRVQDADLVRLLDLLARALEAVKAGADGRTQLELALVKTAAPHTDASTPALLARLERLESAISTGEARSAAGPKRPVREAPSGSGDNGDPPAPRAGSRFTSARAAAGAASDAPNLAPAAPGARAAAPAAAGAALAVVSDPAGESDRGAESEPEHDPVAERELELAPAGISSTTRPDLDELVESWPAVVETVRADKPLLSAVIAKARPVAVDRRELRLAFRPEADFLRRKAQDQANRHAVAEALRTVTGHSFGLAYELREDMEPAAEPATSEDELIARFLAEFDAEELSAEELNAKELAKPDHPGA